MRFGNVQLVGESWSNLLQIVVVVKFYQKCHRGNKNEEKKVKILFFGKS